MLFTDPAGELGLSPEQIRFLCDRRLGVGADEAICAVRSRAIPEGEAILAEELEVEWFINYWNVGGTPAEMCGN